MKHSKKIFRVVSFILIGLGFVLVVFGVYSQLRVPMLLKQLEETLHGIVSITEGTHYFLFGVVLLCSGIALNLSLKRPLTGKEKVLAIILTQFIFILIILPIIVVYSGLYFLLTEDTIYSKCYSEKLFNKIQVGDGMDAVERSLGVPLEVRTFKDSELWLYSESADGGNFKKRWVFIRNGLVDDVIKEDYYD